LDFVMSDELRTAAIEATETAISQVWAKYGLPRDKRAAVALGVGTAVCLAARCGSQ
jgi:hypothetical protein